MRKKKLLFLGVGLYNYDSLIYSELSVKYDVSYIYLVPVKKFSKWKYFLLNHLHQIKYLQKQNSKLILNELEKVKDINFDYVFIIKGSRLETVHMNFLKENYETAKKILYLWDSWTFIENKNVLLGNFDKIYSFDSEDCKKFGFILRPLFYTEKSEVPVNKEYDVSFIGTDHSDRLEKLRAFRDVCLKYNLTFFLRLKTTGYPLLCAKLNYGRFRRDDLKILTTNFLSYTETMNITRKSRYIIDFAHPVQCGLTIRTLEALAMGCKLITSNKYIKEYKDIPNDCYCIITEQNEKDVIDFLSAENIPFIIPERYSLKSFLNDIIQ